MEWYEPWYNIIVTCIGNGVTVVECAGNGREDLDDPIYSTGNGGHWPFLPENNSGVIRSRELQLDQKDGPWLPVHQGKNV